MTRELFSALVAAIKSVQKDGEQLIKHVDLWNRNVEFIDQESAWPRPAVLIEFGQATSRILSGPSISATADVAVTLHIVTDWKGSAADGSAQQDAALEVLDYPWLIAQAVAAFPFRSQKSIGFSICGRWVMGDFLLLIKHAKNAAEVVRVSEVAGAGVLLIERFDSLHIRLCEREIEDVEVRRHAFLMR